MYLLWVLWLYALIWLWYQDRTNEEEQKLATVWREAKHLRRWIVQEKQRMTNELSEKAKEEQEALASSAAEEGAKSSSTSTSQLEVDYEYFRDKVVEKLRLLLMILPSGSDGLLLSSISGTLTSNNFGSLVLTLRSVQTTLR